MAGPCSKWHKLSTLLATADWSSGLPPPSSNVRRLSSACIRRDYASSISSRHSLSVDNPGHGFEQHWAVFRSNAKLAGTRSGQTIGSGKGSLPSVLRPPAHSSDEKTAKGETIRLASYDRDDRLIHLALCGYRE